LMPSDSFLGLMAEFVTFLMRISVFLRGIGGLSLYFGMFLAIGSLCLAFSCIDSLLCWLGSRDWFLG
jgi:hypothetical protein